MNKKFFYKLLFLIIGFSVLGFMVYKIGVDTIIEGLRKMRYWFFAIIALWFVVYCLNTLAWRIIIKDEEGEKIPSFLFLLRTKITGFAINYITPFVAMGGEPYKVLVLKDYMSTSKATSCVILYTMMHIFSHIIFWMSAIVLGLIFYRMSWIPFVSLILLFVIFCFAVLLFLRGYKKGLVHRTFCILSKIPFLKKSINKLLEKKSDRFKEIDSQISNLHTHRRSSFYWSFFMEFLSRYIMCFEVNIIMFALSPMYPGIHISFIDAVMITAGYSLFANLVFFVPMQIGSKEGGYMLAFEAIGKRTSPAFIVSIVTRIRELFWIFIGILLLRTGKQKDVKITKLGNKIEN